MELNDEKLHSVCCSLLSCNNKTNLKSCAGCYTVSYCSKECQTSDWPRHKLACKNGKSSSAWKPSWAVEGRPPGWGKFAPSQDRDMWGSGHFIWGNIPAYDTVNWKQNELKDKDEWLEDFNICFPGMGDLRNVIMTVVSIPTQVKGTIKFYLNDIEPFIMARNVTILLLLLKYGLDGIDAALQVWYSISMTKQQYDMILKMFYDNLSQEDCRRQIFGQTKFFLKTKNTVIPILGAMIQRQWSYGEAYKSRASIMSHPEREDFVERHMYYMNPQYRVPWEAFRREGAFLPYNLIAVHRQYQSVPNKFILHPLYGWTPPESADPLDGWICEEFLLDKKSSCPKNDLYGRLYFYLREKMIEFVKQLSTHKIEFHIFCEDAVSMSEKMKIQELAQFDRIQVSNLTDSNYVGLKAILKAWTPLLNPANEHSALIAHFINWRKRNDALMTKLMQQKVRKTMQQGKLSFDPFEMILQCGQTTEIDAETDHNGEFLQYLKALNISDIDSSLGIERRTVNKIVPPRYFVPLGSDQHQVIVLGEDDLRDNIRLHLNSYTLNERTLEWIRTK